jgi:hypothetical protein
LSVSNCLARGKKLSRTFLQMFKFFITFFFQEDKFIMILVLTCFYKLREGK